VPRGPKGEKRPADVIGNAVHVMRIATGEKMRACRNQENAARIRSKQQSRRLPMLGLGCLVSACSAAQLAPPASRSHVLTADEALAVQSRVTDCEWKAANQYDNGRYTVSEFAQQVMPEALSYFATTGALPQSNL